MNELLQASLAALCWVGVGALIVFITMCILLIIYIVKALKKENLL